MKYFEMLQIIQSKNVSIHFSKSEANGIIVTVCKTVGAKVLSQFVELPEKEFLTGNNGYIRKMIDSILDAEDKILKGLP